MSIQSDYPDDEFTVDGEPLAIDLLSAELGYSFVDEDDLEFIQEAALLGIVDDDDDEPVVSSSTSKTRGRKRSLPAVINLPPTGTQSIYTKLVEYGLLKKLTDIALAKANIPKHLRADATQEMHTKWASTEAKPQFARNQLACYAYNSGKHAASKLRRDIGAVVVIPGGAFRAGRDTPFMQSIGAAVNPKDVDDYTDSLELSVEPQEYSMQPQVVSPDYFKLRLNGLSLTKSQRNVAECVLVRRMSADSIAVEMGVRPAYVERLLGQVTKMLNDKDDEDQCIKVKQAEAQPKHDKKSKIAIGYGNFINASLGHSK